MLLNHHNALRMGREFGVRSDRPQLRL